MAVKIKLSDVTNEKKAELNQVYSVQVDKKHNIPIDSATFVVEGVVKNQGYRNIQATYDFKTLFQGVIDSFETTVSQEGVYTTMRCRNNLALLTDREAKPLVFNTFGEVQLQALYIAPYPFALHMASGTSLTNFAVRKSMSCWGVVELFFIQAFGKRPRLIEGNIISTDDNLRPLFFTVNGTPDSDYPFTHASFKEDTGDLITRIFVKSEVGYVNSVANAYYGDSLEKVRYLDPNGQWVDKTGLQARLMIEESMLLDKVLTLKIPQITQMEIGSMVTFSYRDIYPEKTYRVVEISERLTNTLVETQVRARLER